MPENCKYNLFLNNSKLQLLLLMETEFYDVPSGRISIRKKNYNKQDYKYNHKVDHHCFLGFMVVLLLYGSFKSGILQFSNCDLIFIQEILQFFVFWRQFHRLPEDVVVQEVTCVAEATRTE